MSRHAPGATPRAALALLLATGAAHADHGVDAERGLPMIQTSAPAVFDSPGTPFGPQAFAVERAADGALLVANNEGLLRLHGTGWRTWSPLRGAVLSIAVRADGRVFIGGVGDFGYFDEFGGEFVSLAGPDDAAASGEVWAIAAGAGATWFVARERVQRWDGRRLDAVYAARGELRQAALLGEHAVVFDPAAGLVLLGAQPAQLLPGSAVLAEAGPCALAADAAEVVTLCSDGRFVRWNAQGPQHEVAVDRELARQLTASYVAALARIAPGTYAVGTRRGGLFVVGDDGGFLGHLSQQAGYDDTRIFSLMALDVDGLWIGRDHGLALMEWPGQVSRYDVGLGVPRGPHGVARLDGVLHVVASRGVYRLLPTATGFAAAVPYALTDDVLFDFTANAGALYVASRQGLHEVDADGVERIDPRLSYVPFVMAREPLRLLVGSDRGAWVLERDAAGWRALGELPGVSGEIRRVVAESPAVVWLSSRSARRLLRVDLGDPAAPGWSPARARVIDHSSGPPAGPVLPLPVDGGLVFASAEGVFRYDAASAAFRADPALNAVLPSGHGELRDALPLDGGRVLFAQHDRYRLLRRDGTRWLAETTPLARIPRGATPRSMYRDPDGAIWLSTSDAVYRHVPATQAALPSLPAPRIEMSRNGRAPTPLQPGADVRLGTAPMRVALRFSTAVFVAADQVRFRSRLTPLERGWGPWSDNPVRELTYLPGGDYVLAVQALDAYDRLSAISEITLHAERPWYLRSWALALGVSGLAAAIALLVHVRERRLKARAVALEGLVRERTRALEAASVTDQLTGLHNRHYFALAERQLLEHRGGVLVALIDVDHFKRINDTRGHEAGDRVLQEVARRLRQALPRDAILFRWGGEEFLLLAPLHGALGDAADRVVRLLAEVGGRTIEPGGDAALTVTCSIGWELAASPGDAALREALRHADARLYAAKQAGRDRAHGPFGVARARLDAPL